MNEFVKKNRMVVLAAIVSLVIIIIGAVSYYQREKKDVDSSFATQFTFQSKNKQRQIASWLNQHLIETRELVYSYNLYPLLQNYSMQQTDNTFREIKNRLFRLHNGPEYYSAYFIPYGKAAITLFSNQQTYFSSQDIADVRNSYSAGEDGYISDFKIDSLTGKLYLDILLPVSETNTSENLSGKSMVCLRVNPLASFTNLFQLNLVPYPSASLILAQNRGDSVIVFNKYFFPSSHTEELKSSERKDDIITQIMLKGNLGFNIGTDSRGADVFLYSFVIPKRNWVAIYKIDQEEAYFEIQKYTLSIFFILCGILLVATVVIYTLIKKQQYRFEYALRDSETRQQALITHFDYLTRYANDIVLLLDERGNILQANDQAIDSYKFSLKEMQSFNLEFLTAPDERSKFQKLLFNTRSRGHYIQETLHLRKDGMIFPVEINNRYIKIEDGSCFHTIIRDISEKRLAEKIRRDSEEKYRLIVENQNDLVVKLDPGGRLLYISPSYCRTFEKLESELLGTTFLPTLFEGENREFQSMLRKLFYPPYTCYFEQQTVTPSGTIWLAWNHSVIFNEDGEIDSIIGVGRDITERKITEQALYESEAKFRSMIENSPIGIFLLDARGDLSYINDAALLIADITLEAIKERRWFYAIHREDRLRILQLGREALTEGKSLHCSGRCIHKNGRVVWWDTSTALIMSESVIKGHVGFIINLTDRIEAEQQVMKSREQLKLLTAHLISIREEERAAVARELHDELGQLLTSVKMNVTLLAKEIAKQSESELHNYFLSELQSVSTTIDQSVKGLKKVITELRPQVLENLGLLSAMDWQLLEFKKSSGIPYGFNCQLEDFPLDKSLEVTAFRIFQEALTNVMRHSKATRLDVDVNLAGNNLQLVIADNGIGIQVEKIDRRKSFGILGMQERLEALGGKMEIASKAMQGTKLTITLPVNRKT